MVRDNLLAKSNIGEADLVLGQEYFGSIVTKVQVQVDDSEKRYKIKRFVNLKNGMILVEDYWRDKSLGFMESTEYSLPPGYFGDESPKDDSALREKARALLAKRRSSAAADKEKKKQKRKSKNKEKRRSEKSSSMEPPESRPETAPQPATKPEVVPMTSESESPEREEPSETQTIDERPGSPFSLEGSSEVQDASERAGSPFIQEPSETQELSERGESPVMDKPSEAQETSETPSIMAGDWKTLNATVVPISNLPEEAANYEGDSPQLGVWKHNDPKDDKDWDPLDVVISKTEPSDLAYDEPHGIVAVEEDTKPNSVGKLPAEKLLFFSPGDKPDLAISRPVGIWRPAKSSSQFPPTNGDKTHPRSPSESESPSIMHGDWKTLNATVVPISNLPKEAANYEGDSPQLGVWKHKDDKDWDPLDVVISKTEPSDLAYDEPHGIVAVEEDAKPNSVGKLPAEKLLFFLPGDKPDVSISRPVGIWRPATSSSQFPPTNGNKPHLRTLSKLENEKKEDEDRQLNLGKLPLWRQRDDFAPVKAIVFPQQKAPKENNQDEDAKGVWKSKKAVPDDTAPQEVTLYPKNAALDESKPNGLWGIHRSSIPDAFGQVKPENVIFYPQGETPDDDDGCSLHGKWTSASKEPKKVGKLRSIWKEHIPKKATVYPRRNAPEFQENTENAIGVWKFPSAGTTDPSENWIPADVEIFEVDKKPQDWLDDSTNGVWGLDGPVDSNKGKETPDLVFYPPNEKTEEGFEPLGVWRLPQKQTWPPRRVAKLVSPDMAWGGSPQPKKRSVGKLTVPDIFGEVSPSPGSRRKLPSPAGSRPSIPSTSSNSTTPGDKLSDNTQFPPTNLKVAHPRSNGNPTDKPISEASPMAPESRKSVDPDESSSRKVGKLPKWQREDDWISDKAMVYPPGKAPRDIMLDHLSRGTWRSSDQLPDDWVPLEVTIVPEHSDVLDEENPNGIWGINSLSETDESGRWRPEDVLFYPPGEVPGEDCSRRGRWSVGGGKWPPRGLDLPVKPSRFESSSVSEFDEEPANDSSPSGRRVGKLPNWQSGDDWVPERAMVSLRRNAPEENTLGDVPRGVWKSKNALPDDWVPQELVMHPRQADVETETPNGLWGTNAASEVDENGLWRPEDILFYPPNESPEDDCEVRGRWTLGEKAKWPPISGAMPRASNERKVGKLPKWQSDNDWVSDKAIVFSSKNAPSDSTDDVPRGIWKSKNPLPDNMEAQEVIVYPNNSTLDESKPNGIWGTSSVSTPDRNGRWAPKDVMFYPPNETPKKDECTPRGRWSVGESAVLPFALDLPNPPAREVSPEPRPAEFRESIASPTRTPRQVGKLKVPGVFEKSPGASPRVSARRTPTSASRKRLLLRNSIAAEKRPVLPSILEEDWETLPATVVSDSTGSLADTIEGAEMENASDPPVGVWKHSEKMDDSTWGAVDVTVHRTKPNDLKAGEPYGTVAVIPDAKANSVGKIQPRQLQFFAPGADTDPPSLRKVGVWRFSEPGGGWPPNGSNRNVGRLSQIASNFDSPRKSNKVGKLPKWQTTDGDWKSSRGIVFPRKHAPRGNIDDVSRGVWKSKNPIDDNWEAQDVVLHPENTPAIDDGTPNGIWGTLSSSEPDEKGQWKPHDVLFYPPGEAPGEECKRRGKWSLSLGPKAKWPPAVTSFVSPSRVSKLSGLPSPVSSPSPRTRSVGKLKLPDLFSGK